MVTSKETSLPADAVDGLLFETARSADCANAAGTSPEMNTQMARERRRDRRFPAQEYSNLSSAADSFPFGSPTPLYVIFPPLTFTPSAKPGAGISFLYSC